MLLVNLPAHERKFYQLSFTLLAITLVMGLLIGGINAGESTNNRTDNWQASELRPSADTLADFNSITTQSRWFVEGGQSKATANVIDTDEVESFHLLGIVDKGGQRYALFMPPATDAGHSKMVQLATGEPLVGDWKLQEITSTKVIVSKAADNETRELLLYGAPTKAAKAPVAASKHTATAKSAKSSGASEVAAKARDASPRTPTKDRPKRDKAEIEKNRAQRAETVAKRKADSAHKKAEKDKATKR